MVSVVNGLVLCLLTLGNLWGYLKFDMILSYQWHKILHVFGVVIFMGNMIAGPAWFLFAYYSKDKNLLRFAAKVLERTDMILTIPGIALAVINGLYLAAPYGGIKLQQWIYLSTLLLISTWVLSIPLIYLQEKLFKAIERDENETKLYPVLIGWSITGSLITVPFILIFYLMIAKGL